MLGANTSRDSTHKCAVSNTNTWHIDSQKFPAIMQPNTALQCSLRQSSNHCRITVSRKTRQGAAQCHTTAHWKPNRHPYTTIRPFVTQSNTPRMSSTCSFTARITVSNPVAQSRTFQFTHTGNPHEIRALDRSTHSTRRMYTPTTFEITSRQCSRSPMVKSS